MGHEIAHAIARHGNERMSQQLALAGIVGLTGPSDSTQERLKVETSALVDDSYELKQGQEYESAGNELLNKANELRESANAEKDPIAKKELLNEAASTELAAVEKINKAKKLYSSAIVEQYSLSSPYG